MDPVERESRGLWNPGRSASPVRHLVVFLVTPLALALLFDDFDGVATLARAYLGSLVVTVAIGGGFELAYELIWPALVRGRLALRARVAGHVVTIGIVVAAGAFIADRFGRAVLGWDAAFPRLWRQGTVISSVVIAILVISDELAARSRDLVRREAAHRVAMLRAELSALQARTDPHFLFNSLNTVAALIPDDPALAESLLERLAAVFHYALAAGRRAVVPLAEEIAAVTAYLEVEALRLGARLRWTVACEPSLAATQVPPLVLQPLVENAIRHGAGARQGTTEVTVSASRRGDALVLAVVDRGLDDEPTSPVGGGTGTAVAELRARLALAYDGRARLDAGPAAAGWRAEVTLPLAVTAARPREDAS